MRLRTRTLLSPRVRRRPTRKGTMNADQAGCPAGRRRRARARSPARCQIALRGPRGRPPLGPSCLRSGSHAEVERALVVGGSVASLLAARVLADHADEVVVVDRDELADDLAERKGVPQGRHVHGLLSRGLQKMERLFPSITTELTADGGEIADPGIDLDWYVTGARKPPAGIGTGVACTRPFLETHLRRRLRALPAVGIVHGRVDRLTATNGRVDGAVLEGTGAEGERLGADLVVDCSGRTSHADAWLGALGYDAPPRRAVNVELGYATRLFPRQPEDRLGGGRGVFSITEEPDRFRGAVAFP